MAQKNRGGVPFIPAKSKAVAKDQSRGTADQGETITSNPQVPIDQGKMASAQLREIGLVSDNKSAVIETHGIVNRNRD